MVPIFMKDTYAPIGSGHDILHPLLCVSEPYRSCFRIASQTIRRAMIVFQLLIDGMAIHTQILQRKVPLHDHLF